MDDASQVRHAAAQVIRAVIWLRDEEARTCKPDVDQGLDQFAIVAARYASDLPPRSRECPRKDGHG